MLTKHIQSPGAGKLADRTPMSLRQHRTSIPSQPTVEGSNSHTMPPRLNLFTANKAVSAFRRSAGPSPRTVALPLRTRAAQSTQVQKRWNSSKYDQREPGPDEQKFPTQDQLPHVGEEAAEIDRIMNKEKSCDGQPSSPELEQGTPVEEVSAPQRVISAAPLEESDY